MANDVVLTVRAEDEASKTLSGIGKAASGLGSAIRKGALVGGVALAGLGVASVKMALDFERSFAEVKTLLPQLSEQAFGKLQDDLLAFSKEMGIATDQTVPALYQAISAGVPPDNVMTFMETAAKASIGGVTDLEVAVDGITSVINSYGSEVIDAQQASDIMFTAVRLGKTTFDELSASLFNVLPTASSLGISFEEVSAAMAVMTAQGIPTSVATTKLRQAFVEASKGGTLLSDAIIDLTGKSFAQLISEGATASEIFNELRGSMPLQEFKDLVPATEALDAILAITGPNAEAMASAMGETGNSVGATDAAFQTMADTAGFKLNKAFNSLKIQLMEIGLDVLPFLTDALGVLAEWLDVNVPKAIDGLKSAFASAKPTIIGFGEAFASGLVPVKAFFNFLLDNKALLIAAIAAIGVAVVLALGPAASATLAILGFIALLGLAKEAVDDLGKFLGLWAEKTEQVIKPIRELRLAQEATARSSEILADTLEEGGTVADAQALILDDLALRLADVSFQYDQTKRILDGWTDAMGNTIEPTAAQKRALEELDEAQRILVNTIISEVNPSFADLEAALLAGGISGEATLAILELFPETLGEVGEATEEVTALQKEFAEATEEEMAAIVAAVKSILPAVDETYGAWERRLREMVLAQSTFQGNMEIINRLLVAGNVGAVGDIMAVIQEMGPQYALQFTRFLAEDPVRALEVLRGVAPMVVGQTVQSMGGVISDNAPFIAASIETGYGQPLFSGIVNAGKDAITAAQITALAITDAFGQDLGASLAAAGIDPFADVFADLERQAAFIGPRIFNAAAGGVAGSGGVLGTALEEEVEEVLASFGDTVKAQLADLEFAEAAGSSAASLMGALRAAIEEQTPQTIAALDATTAAMMFALQNGLPPGQGEAWGAALMKALKEALETGGIAAVAAILLTTNEMAAVFEAMKEAAEEELEEIVDVFKEFQSSLGDIAQDRRLEEQFGQMGVSLFEALKQAIETESPGAIDALAREAQRMMDTLREELGSEEAAGIIARLMAAIQTAIQAGGEGALGALATILMELKGLIADAAGDIADVSGGGGSTVARAARATPTSLQLTTAAGLTRRLTELGAPIRSFAHGGFVPPGGVVPAILHGGARGETITPVGAGSGGLTINFNAPVYGFLDFEETVTQITRDTWLRGGFRGLPEAG